MELDLTDSHDRKLGDGKKAEDVPVPARLSFNILVASSSRLRYSLSRASRSLSHCESSASFLTCSALISVCLTRFSSSDSLTSFSANTSSRTEMED